MSTTIWLLDTENALTFSVELEIEKRLGFTNKNQIEEYGIDAFNEICRKSVFEYIQDWEKLSDRIAFWVNLDNAYVTFTNEYIESVWWILKRLRKTTIRIAKCRQN